MFYSWLTSWVLFADDELPKADATKGGDGPPAWSPLPMILAMAAVFYLLIMVPNRRERKQRQSMMSALKKNDRVVTSGGIVGVVVGLKEGTEEVTIRSEDTKLLILRSSIARIIAEPDKEPGAPAKPAT